MTKKRPTTDGLWTFYHPFGTTTFIPRKKRAGRTKLTSVIAEKSFTVRKRDGTLLQVVVRVGKPFPARKSKMPDDYFCPVQILGVGNGAVANIGGEDSFVALRYAFDYVTLRLDALAGLKA